ncbi:MAG: thioesterase family protein [Rhodobacteraceae bacterium]|nr:thioesterase family protein [Paracoccaceae bacterium]
MTQISLTQILDQMAPDGARLMEPLPQSWLQGRTAFGGLTSALLLEATRRAHPGLPPLRSVLVNFTAPVGGAPSFATQVLRQGRNITTITCDALDGDKVLARATFTFGGDIPDSPTHDLPPPNHVAPDAAPDAFGRNSPFRPPAFLENFELRFLDGAPPFSGAKRGMLRGWTRHRAEDARRGIVPFLCLADVLPPAGMIKRTGPVVNSSVTWICNILRPEVETEDGWYHVEMDLSAEHQGYSSQVMRIWDREGRLVSDGMQSVVIFPLPPR